MFFEDAKGDNKAADNLRSVTELIRDSSGSDDPVVQDTLNEALGVPMPEAPPVVRSGGHWGKNWEYVVAAGFRPSILPEGTKRKRRPVKRLGMAAAAAVQHEPELEELLEYCFMASLERDPNDTVYSEAKINEMGSMAKHQVWTLVPRKDCPTRPVSVRWVCTMKDMANGSKRPKARLVARGHTQRAGLDYEEIFAPVVKMESLRYILAQVCLTGMKIAQGDVKTAFLTSEIEGPAEGISATGEGELDLQAQQSNLWIASITPSVL